MSQKLLSHSMGVGVHAPSRPLVMVSLPLPLPWVFSQPKPIEWTGQPSGSGPTRSGSPAPWVLPKVWPPAISATVSSSFIAIAAKVTRMSWAAESGSALLRGPSGLT